MNPPDDWYEPPEEHDDEEPELDERDLAELRLRSYDYEGWCNL